MSSVKKGNKNKRKKSSGVKKQSNRPTIQNKKLREVSKEIFNKEKVTKEELKEFRDRYKWLKAKGELTRQDIEAVKNISKTFKKLREEGKIKGKESKNSISRKEWEKAEGELGKIGSTWEEEIEISDINNKALREKTEKLKNGEIGLDEFRKKYQEIKKEAAEKKGIEKEKAFTEKDVEASMKVYKAKLEERNKKKS